jgi:hypothetical protein
VTISTRKSKFGTSSGRIFVLAHENAVVETLEAIASAAGVAEIKGQSIRDWFEMRKHTIAQELVADFADTNPKLASQIKSAWDSLDRRHAN